MAKILLVDDNEISLMMTDMVLSEMHYDVTTATSGEAAIERLQQYPYDLMLLDIVMEGMNGIETLARIREMPEIRNIRTIFLTSSSQITDMTEAIRLGALDFIRKPTLPETLLSAVQKALLVQKKTPSSRWTTTRSASWPSEGCSASDTTCTAFFPGRKLSRSWKKKSPVSSCSTYICPV